MINSQEEPNLNLVLGEENSAIPQSLPVNREIRVQTIWGILDEISKTRLIRRYFKTIAFASAASFSVTSPPDDLGVFFYLVPVASIAMVGITTDNINWKIRALERLCKKG